MDSKTVTLEIAKDGTLIIPVDLVRALRLSPRQTITVETKEGALVIVPSIRTGPGIGHRERADRISELLRFALADVEWSEIEDGRRDRCFSA